MSFKKIGHWIKSRLIDIPERDKRSSIWLISSCFLATAGVAIIQAFGSPTGSSVFAHIKDIAIATGLNGLGFLAVTFILAFIFSICYVKIPRLFAGSLLYLMTVSVLVLYFVKSGILFSFVVGISFSLVAVLIGLLIMMFTRYQKARFAILALIFTAVIGRGAFLFFQDHSEQPSSTPVTAYQDADEMQNPGQPGRHDVTFLTYGSGKDVHREAFGSDVDEKTSSVDASSFITTWGEKREKFWKFNPSDFPINGRVWVPQDKGPFPVILMVHGNHTMEYFSVDGYDYLGKQLASRGFVTISVDEDFINYSNHTGQPNDNYELRAWMLLQHLVQLKSMNQSSEHPLYQKIDMTNVALMGHSRGGQAAPMAADYETFFDEEELLQELDDIQIQAVAALAPTDKTIDGQKPYLHNTSYIVLQGARDADISDFRGNRQFHRTTFDSSHDGLKTSLYMADANHVQFNSSWGKMDLSLPRGLFLNHSKQMKAVDQRQIAKVYLSAFFERVFHGEHSYDALFRDYRYGDAWLPDEGLVSQYRNAAYQTLKGYDTDDIDVSNLSGFKHEEVTTPVDRGGTDHLQNALQLEWDQDATYELSFPKRTIGHQAIVLSMANIDEEAGNDSVPEIEIELETNEGITVTLPLDEFMLFPPVIQTNYTTFGWFDSFFRDGKYEESWEPVFQTFEIPIDAFESVDPNFRKENVVNMKLHFISDTGKILLEEVGVQ